MTKKRIAVFVLLLGAFAVSFAAMMFDVFGEQRPQRIYDVSVIMRGKSSDSRNNIRQGAEQAASDMHVSLSFITLAYENAAQEQIAVLQREIDSGAEAIVLSAADRNMLEAPVQAAKDAGIPVICIESEVAGNAPISRISADDFLMGAQLGERIGLNVRARRRSIAILDSSAGNENILRRRQGIESQLLALEGTELHHWNAPTDATAFAQRLKDEQDSLPDALVTLEAATLEVVAQAIVDAQIEGLDLYGLGNSGKIASFIEQDIIVATIVQNDFAIGYLGVKAAVDALSGRPPAPQAPVEHRLITYANMYDRQAQRLLFPFIR